MNVVKVALIKCFNLLGYEFTRLQDTDRYTERYVDALRAICRDVEPSIPGKNFTFVQIGANNGVRWDAIRCIIKPGWHGVLLEPNPIEFAALRQNYSGWDNLKFECSAVGEQSGSGTLYSSTSSSTDSLLGSLSRESTEKALRGTPSIRDKKLVSYECKVITLAELYRRYDIKNLSLLLTDTEGFDYAIMRQVLKENWLPDVMCYEHSFMTSQQQNELRTELSRKGYETMLFNPNTIASKVRK